MPHIIGHLRFARLVLLKLAETRIVTFYHMTMPKALRAWLGLLEPRMPDQESKQVQLFFSNRLDILSAQLAAVLKLDLAASAAGDLHFKRPQIIIESPECAAYVKMQLAKEHGIWANFKISRSLKSLVLQAYYSKGASRLLTKNLMVSAILASSEEVSSGKTLNAVELSKAIALAELIEASLLQKPGKLKKPLNKNKWPDGVCNVDVDGLTGEFEKIWGKLPKAKKNGQGKPDLEFVLPHEIVKDTSFWNEFDANSRLYIFDPSPYSAVDLLWLQALSKHVEIVIFAFSPCASYWENIKASVRDLPPSLVQSDESSSQNEDCDFWTKDKWGGHFLLERCGRISNELARVFSVASKFDPIESYVL